MRVLVYPHSMEIGGSQLNAIELAAAVRDRGHDVLLLSEPGPLTRKVSELRLEHLVLDEPCRPLSLRFLHRLTRLVERYKIDIVHGYEWPTAMAFYFGPHLWMRTPVVCTVMSMAVPPFLPKSMPLVVGTEALRLDTTRHGREEVTLIEPPVDTEANSPAYDGSTFRSQHGLDSDALQVIVVGRLANDLKLEGLLSACDAIGTMVVEGRRVQLTIVGDGAARKKVAQRADLANARTGKRAVLLAGEMMDPRPAYAAADVLLGMGGSAIRCLAFGKPLIVQGELGFWKLLTPKSLGQFLHTGWYGIGDLPNPIDEAGLAISATRLRYELEPLLTDHETRNALATFGRQIALDRFNLRTAAEIQEAVYALASAGNTKSQVWEMANSAPAVISYRIRQRLQRWTGSQTSEDFNSLTRIKAIVGTTRNSQLGGPA